MFFIFLNANAYFWRLCAIKSKYYKFAAFGEKDFIQFYLWNKAITPLQKLKVVPCFHASGECKCFQPFTIHGTLYD
jgi:hypothetical protein